MNIVKITPSFAFINNCPIFVFIVFNHFPNINSIYIRRCPYNFISLIITMLIIVRTTEQMRAR